MHQVGIRPDAVCPVDIDETPRRGELPRSYCIRMASEKLARAHDDAESVTLAADTIVAVNRRILGKPRDESQATQFLQLLSGRRHRVITAIAVKSSRGSWKRDIVSIVRLKGLAKHEIDAYVASGEWHGKAGGYGIQGRAAAFVQWISGSYPGIVGLPLVETVSLLRTAGLDPGGRK